MEKEGMAFPRFSSRFPILIIERLVNILITNNVPSALRYENCFSSLHMQIHFYENLGGRGAVRHQTVPSKGWYLNFIKHERMRTNASLQAIGLLILQLVFVFIMVGYTVRYILSSPGRHIPQV